ncbi:hypothetical protein F2Q70_00014936, partial [Brassica cretica]
WSSSISFISSTEAAYSPNVKRKVESGFGLFCVMRKRARGDDDDDMSSSDFDYAEKDKSLIGSESLSICNSDDDKISLGISSMPLTKTLGGPGRQWSVCGSVTAVRNIPLLGDSSAAFSSLDEQLDVNVSTSEGRDAEADGEDDMSFSDIDAMIRRLNLIPNDSDSCLDMEERNMSKLPRHTLLGLEHCSVTSDGHHQSLSSTEAAYSPNAKRKVESGFGLFCVMRKRARGDDDDMSSSDFDYAEKGDDFFCSDTDLSECSEFDVISHHVVQDKSLIGSESLSTCNSDDDKISLGITSMPLTKTLGGPGRQWSVCGSVTAVRNIPLLGDSSAAFSSLDEQLDVNVSTSEGRDAEADGEDDMSFSDIDAMIRRLNLIPDDSDSCLDMEERNMSKLPRHTLLGLEHCSVTSVPRGIISQGAIAVLHCRDSKHFIRKQEQDGLQHTSP